MVDSDDNRISCDYLQLSLATPSLGCVLVSIRLCDPPGCSLRGGTTSYPKSVVQLSCLEQAAYEGAFVSLREALTAVCAEAQNSRWDCLFSWVGSQKGHYRGRPQLCSATLTWVEEIYLEMLRARRRDRQMSHAGERNIWADEFSLLPVRPTP